MIIPGSYREVKKSLLEGTITYPDLVKAYLAKAREREELNVYIEIYTEEALVRAEELQKKLLEDRSAIGKLFGMVVSLKDVIAYKDHKLTAGSKILQGFTSLYDATAVERLLAEDAIIIGRVNCDEFAMGSSNENSYYGPTKNGADPERVPGGSSGASAVSVQIDSCMVSLGSDTGGSVRQPASFCGVIGFKPSYGRISRYGLIAYGSSFDQIGLISKDHEAIAEVLSVIAGKDEYDSTASLAPVEKYSDFSSEKKYKIAYLQEAIDHPSVSDDNRRSFQSFIDDAKTEGHSVEAISFELLDYLVPTYYILTTAEASSNLSRYDGVRYGYRSEEAHDINELYKKSRGEGFGLEVKRRIMLGTFVLSEGYFDAYYRKAQAARRKIKAELDNIFSDYDFLILPCTTGPAWKIGSMDNDPVEVYLSDVFTVLANLTGVTAASIPFNQHKYGTDNYGLQILGPYMGEKNLLSFINIFIKLA